MAHKCHPEGNLVWPSVAVAFNTAVDNHRSHEDANAKISKILYTEEERGLALLFEVGLVPFIMTSGCTLGRPGRRSLAPLERKRGIKQRDCCTEICESHIEDTMTTIVRGIISPHYSLSLPVEHLGPIHYLPLRALNSSHTCVVMDPVSYGETKGQKTKPKKKRNGKQLYLDPLST
jgi:hypothetical protein